MYLYNYIYNICISKLNKSLFRDKIKIKKSFARNFSDDNQLAGALNNTTEVANL